MDGQPQYTPADIARELGVTKMTVRNWSARYAEFLSDAAAPKPGAQRKYTHRDRVVLAYINQLVNDGHRHEFIAQRVGETKFTEAEYTEADLLAHVAEADQVPAQAPQAAEIATIAAMLADAHVKQLEDIRGRLSQLEATQAEQRHKDRLTIGVAVGIAVGALLVGIIAVIVIVLMT